MANKTQENLLKAIAGESMARNKYTYFAEIAMKEGLVWIAKVFEETADNERAHAKEELERVKGKAEMTNTYDIHALADTLTNLKNAAEGEKYEWGVMYPDFEKQAREEGESEIADMFREIGEVEEKHEERYNILAGKLQNGTLLKSDKEVEWKCLNCGYVHKGTSAPDKCPVCAKPQGWYMQLGVVR
ncbi:MAG: rubrerythrin family protein [Candidatus Pacebacteria bacterium]|nr:rubrerythrin family protein [Candidatus Paceibacterota bacterium]